MPELFANFEVNRQPRWPVILRLLSGSLVVHLTLAVSVIYVPTMRDAFSIAAMAGLARYTEKAYTKTVIGQDINMVQIGDKFHYPDGYFAAGVLATGAPVPTPDPFAPRIISEAKSATAGNAASPSPSPSPGASPSSAAFGGDASASPTAAKSLETKSPDDASKELERVAVENNVLVPDEDEINKLPLKDWLANANGKREKGQLDLDALVEITIEAKLNANCKLSDPKVVQKSGDPRMIEVATDLASAISDSNMLSFLKDPAKHKAEMNPPCEAGPLRLTVKLDQSKVSASVASQADSTERATQLATAYNWMLGIGAATAKTKHKDDESAIFQNTKVRSDGKQVIVDFNMPRQTAGELLKKQVEAKPAS